MKKRYKLLFLFAFCLAGRSAHGQTTYHDINPDTTVSTWAPFVIEYGSSELYIWYHPFEPNQVVVNGFGIQVLFNGRHPARLDAGAEIKSSATWKEPQYDTMNIGGVYGNWINVTDKYLGFRFQFDGQWHYAWLRMDVDSTPTQFTVKDLAYNATPNGSIMAGDKGNSIIKESSMNKPKVTVSHKTITFPNLVESYNVKVYDASGKQVFQAISNGLPINLDALPAGVYMLHLANCRNQFTYKLLLP